MNTRFIFGFVLVVVALLIVSGAVFTVRQTQQALVLQFGEPKRGRQSVGDTGLRVVGVRVRDVQADAGLDQTMDDATLRRGRRHG